MLQINVVSSIHPALGLVVLRHDLSLSPADTPCGNFCHLTEGRTDDAIGYSL
jgi:hypothetical protein